MKLIFSFSDPVNFPGPRAALLTRYFPIDARELAFPPWAKYFQIDNSFLSFKTLLRPCIVEPGGIWTDGHDLDKYNSNANRRTRTKAILNEVTPCDGQPFIIYSYSPRRRLPSAAALLLA